MLDLEFYYQVRVLDEDRSRAQQRRVRIHRTHSLAGDQLRILHRLDKHRARFSQLISGRATEKGDAVEAFQGVFDGSGGDRQVGRREAAGEE